MVDGRDGLTPVRRMDKNGQWATRYIRPVPAEGHAQRTVVPPPSIPFPKAAPQTQHVADSDDPRVQGGEVIDRIVHRKKLYSRARDGVTPGLFDSVRIQLNRPLRKGEAAKIAAIVGATTRSHFGLPEGARALIEDIDSDYSVIVRTDTFGAPVANFPRNARMMHRSLPRKLVEGTAAIPGSDRGPGMPAAEGLGDEGLTFEVYYDAVDGDPATEVASGRGSADAEVIESVLSSETTSLNSGIL